MAEQTLGRRHRNVERRHGEDVARFLELQQKVADLGPGSADFQISKDGSRAAGFAGDGIVEIWDLSRAPIAGIGEELRSRICAANRQATPAFRRADREGNDPVAAYLKGRPWRVCDWRGLGQAAGWVQSSRYWAVKWGLLPDYRPQ